MNPISSLIFPNSFIEEQIYSQISFWDQDFLLASSKTRQLRIQWSSSWDQYVFMLKGIEHHKCCVKRIFCCRENQEKIGTQMTPDLEEVKEIPCEGDIPMESISEIISATTEPSYQWPIFSVYV